MDSAEEQANQEGKKIDQEAKDVLFQKEQDFIPTKDKPLFVKSEQCSKCESWGFYAWVEEREDGDKDFVKECLICKDRVILKHIKVSFMDV